MSIYLKRQGVPKELAEVYVDFYWSQEKLWNLIIEAEEVKIAEIEWILDLLIWYMDVIKIPRFLIDNPNLDKHHWNRVESADLTYPIHLIRWKKRLLVLDGIHRLIKAMTSEQDRIFAKVLNQNHVNEILPKEDDFNHGFLKTVKFVEET